MILIDFISKINLMFTLKIIFFIGKKKSKLRFAKSWYPSVFLIVVLAQNLIFFLIKLSYCSKEEPREKHFKQKVYLVYVRFN